MSILPAVAVFVGAGTGALLRWWLGLALNPLVEPLPLGTLAANVIGGLLMGIALGLLTQFEELSPVWRLAFTTGFLGGLTTFSTYTAEAALLLTRGQLGWASLHAVLHVVGSLAATLIGLFSAQALLRGAGGGS